MQRRARLSRWTVQLAVLLLLFKAAVPWLASLAAMAQGTSVADVCDVYGVALPGHTHRLAAAQLVPQRHPEHGAENSNAPEVSPHADADAAHHSHDHHRHQLALAAAQSGDRPGLSTPPQGISVAASEVQPATTGLGHGEGAPHSRAEHRSDHCVLTALAAAATPDTAFALAWGAPAQVPLACPSGMREPVADATARWAVLVHHGPPIRS